MRERDESHTAPRLAEAPPSRSPQEKSSTPPPRVCMVLESFYPVVGGMETQACNLAESLRDLGVSVCFVTRRTERTLPPREVVHGFPVLRVPPTGAFPAARWAMMVTVLPALRKLASEYDLVLVPGFRTLGVPAVAAGRRLGKPVILKAESCGEMSGEFFAAGLQRLRLSLQSFGVRHLMQWRTRWLIRADAIVSLSRDMTEEYRRAGVPPERIHVIPQSVDVQRFRPSTLQEKQNLRRKLGLALEDRIAVFTGRLVSYKGLPVLMRVWAHLARECPRVHLVICGAGGTDLFNWEPELKRFVEDHRLADVVTLPGAVRNVEDYLRAADLYVFPTENEAFPLALLEAMACGLPVVATPVGGIPDVVTDGWNGRLVPPRDESALAHALRTLLDDPALRERLGQQALTTVLRRYTREHVAAQYVTLFEQCLQARRGA